MRVYIFVEVKKDLQTKIQYCFEINKRTPLDIYNGSSQVDCIKPEGRIHCKKRIKQCVNFSGSKTMTPSEAMQNNQAIILNETSKPPVNTTHFFNIAHLLLNCLT